MHGTSKGQSRFVSRRSFAAVVAGLHITIIIQKRSTLDSRDWQVHHCLWQYSPLTTLQPRNDQSFEQPTTLSPCSSVSISSPRGITVTFPDCNIHGMPMESEGLTATAPFCVQKNNPLGSQIANQPLLCVRNIFAHFQQLVVIQKVIFRTSPAELGCEFLTPKLHQKELDKFHPKWSIPSIFRLGHMPGERPFCRHAKLSSLGHVDDPPWRLLTATNFSSIPSLHELDWWQTSRAEQLTTTCEETHPLSFWTWLFSKSHNVSDSHPSGQASSLFNV